jgi:hypothetical protein
MSKVKSAREQWVEKFIDATLELEPRATIDDVAEDAWELYEKWGKEVPREAAKRLYGGPRTESVLGENTPAWMKPKAEVPPGWRYEGGAWRNN